MTEIFIESLPCDRLLARSCNFATEFRKIFPIQTIHPAPAAAMSVIDDRAVESDWYKPQLPAEEASTLLAPKGDGAFVIRASSTNKNQYVLSYWSDPGSSIIASQYRRHRGSIHHTHVVSDEDGIHLKKSEKYFATMSAMVDFYWCARHRCMHPHSTTQLGHRRVGPADPAEDPGADGACIAYLAAMDVTQEPFVDPNKFKVERQRFIEYQKKQQVGTYTSHAIHDAAAGDPDPDQGSRARRQGRACDGTQAGRPGCHQGTPPIKHHAIDIATGSAGVRV